MQEIRLEDVLTSIGQDIEKILPGKGFVLLVYDFGKTGFANYATNTQRQEMAYVLREAAARIESNSIIEPNQAN